MAEVYLCRRQNVLQQQLPVQRDRRPERSLRGRLGFLLRNEHSFMGREIQNVWQSWLEANALFTEICVLMLLMFSFRSLGQ